MIIRQAQLQKEATHTHQKKEKVKTRKVRNEEKATIKFMHMGEETHGLCSGSRHKTYSKAHQDMMPLLVHTHVQSPLPAHAHSWRHSTATVVTMTMMVRGEVVEV